MCCATAGCASSARKCCSAMPIRCSAGQGDDLVLAGRGGSLARSGDGGVTWSQLADLATPTAPGGVVLALAAGRDGTLVAAIQRSGAVLIVSADGPDGPWQVIAALDAELSDPPRACLTALADGALLLCLPGRVLRSTDGGAAWEPVAGLPAGWGTLHPLQLGSGRLVAPVGAAAGEIALGESDDGGATWNVPEGFAPLSAPLVQLPDGRLVLSYGHAALPLRRACGRRFSPRRRRHLLGRRGLRPRPQPLRHPREGATGAGRCGRERRHGGDRGRHHRLRLPPRPGSGLVCPHHLRPRHGRVGPAAGGRRGALDPRGPGETAAGLPQPVERPGRCTGLPGQRHGAHAARRPLRGRRLRRELRDDRLPARAGRAPLLRRRRRQGGGRLPPSPTAAWSTPAATAASTAPPTRAARGTSWPRSRSPDAIRRSSASG